MGRPSEIQQSLIDKLRDHDPELDLEWDDARGIARRARGRLPAGADNTDVAENALRGFLADYGPLFGPDDAKSAFAHRRTRSDDLGWLHVTLAQVVHGGAGLPGRPRVVPVNGASIAGHFAPDGGLTEIQSSCWPAAELPPPADPPMGPEDLRKHLLGMIQQKPGFARLAAEVERRREEKAFPLMQAPALVLQPWKGGFRLVWLAHGYAPAEVRDPAGNPTGEQSIDFGDLIFDAASGELLDAAPTRKYAETPTTGTGTGVTPLASPATRTLDIVRVDTTSTYRLRDTTRNRDVITYDVAASTSWSSRTEIVSALAGGTLPVSADTDGNKAWTTTAANTTDAQRTASQQPEVEAHFLCGDLYEWYDALASGRDGWDDGNYASPPVPNQPVRVLTHAYDDGASTSRSVNAYMDRGMSGGNWYAFLAFFDGNPTATCTTANDRAYDYLAGSKFIVGHEYQHAITDFSFEDASGNPGLTYSGWFAAVHEGLSDVFGTLYAEEWLPGPEISTANLVFRNLAFPRDPNAWVNRTGGIPCGLNNANKDHWDDRNLSTFQYNRGTILAHAAYLHSAGGVHQRASRTPALIPVTSLGHETVNGRSVLRAARIWYRALTQYFSTHGALTGIPTNDEATFRTIRNGCVSAAIDIYGSGSREHRTTVLAFYAVGMQPTGTAYGADVAFLPWGAAWWRSRPFVGLPSPDWASLDLFVNNGGASEWNAQVNVLDAGGNPTQFENTVYCRVRNVGDQAASNVQLSFEYAKVGTAPTAWLPVTDKNGVAQTLNLGSLAAGASSFPDSAQNSPPASASVKWYLPPLAAGETIDHFCLRATVSSSNDVNSHNNTVQSNISYVAYTPSMALGMAFLAGNPTEEPVALELVLDAGELPKGWRASLGSRPRRALKPGEEVAIELKVAMGAGGERRLDPPYDGQVVGTVYGALTGRFSGSLTEARLVGRQLTGRLTGVVGRIEGVGGTFEGTLDRLTGRLDGLVRGSAGCDDDGTVCFGFEGCLRPFRRVNVTQVVDGDPIGGVTLQVQVPPLHRDCDFDRSAATTRVEDFSADAGRR